MFLTNANKCSILILTKKKKSVCIIGVGAPPQIDFFNTYLEQNAHLYYYILYYSKSSNISSDSAKFQN